jgi:hypothetical protein
MFLKEAFEMTDFMKKFDVAAQTILGQNASDPYKKGMGRVFNLVAEFEKRGIPSFGPMSENEGI